jgi:hypothetical protein
MTLHEDRPISRQEVEIVSWLLRNASTKEPLNHLLDGVDRLRVVGRCGCGCASVDFEKDGQSGGRHPIAEATAESPTGLNCGVILWGRDGAVTGLEIYEMDPDSTNTLPRFETLKPWDAS